MRDHNQPTDEVDSLVRDAMQKDLPPETEARLRRQLGEFRVRLANRAEGRPATRRVALSLGRAAAVVLTVLAVAGYMFAGRSTPTWADVMERFASVSFLHATIYVRNDAVSEPAQLDIWMGHGGKLRLRVGGKVAFGDNGRVIDEVAIAPATAASKGLLLAEATVAYFINKMGRVDTFSFETLMQLLPEMSTISTPLRNQEASISRDLVVFDMTNEEGPEWVRIWALRESRLPVRVLFWDPRNAQTTDVLLSYGNEQPPAFFDLEAFKARLAAGGGTAADRAYALLEDVGGRPVTPQDAAALAERRRQKALEAEAATPEKNRT